MINYLPIYRAPNVEGDAIGTLSFEDGQFFVEFIEPVKRDDFFNMINCGAHMVEHEIRGDDLYIKKAQLMCLSFDPIPAVPA